MKGIAMSPSDVQEFLDDHTTDRIRVIMASGDHLTIEDTARTLIGGMMLYIELYNDPLARSGRRVRAVSIPNINVLEPIRRGSNGGRARRRR